MSYVFEHHVDATCSTVSPKYVRSLHSKHFCHYHFQTKVSDDLCCPISPIQESTS
uniref:Uncharacterized protein n=1 Tax=Arundo donax TaxID=35708 RepID=A0A0A9BA42_ARUDO